MVLKILVILGYKSSAKRASNIAVYAVGVKILTQQRIFQVVMKKMIAMMTKQKQTQNQLLQYK